MKKSFENQRILVVTPEVTFIQHGMEPGANGISARASGLGDICAAHVQELYGQGLDVHLALPNYRKAFKASSRRMPGIGRPGNRCVLPKSHIHLAQDRSFYYPPDLPLTVDPENLRIALAFQREVINRIIPEVRPDLIHCYDWMTGLIPAMARRYRIPSFFSLYHLDSARLLLSTIEERGIDAVAFWQYCYYSRMPAGYQDTRSTNPLDLLASGLFAADRASVPSETFLHALTDKRRHNAPPLLEALLTKKFKEERLGALSPVPDSSFNPIADHALVRPYGPETHFAGKLFNKLKLQEVCGLHMDSNAPLCFWPTRLDGARPGCRLMAETLSTLLDRYREQCLQMVVIAEGDFKTELSELIGQLHATDRVYVGDYSVRRCRMAYAGADFLLMPIHLDPCALPCKIGQRYGALPIAHDAGAIHDCVQDLDCSADCGAGFLFKHFDANGFLWAVDQAMDFYNQPSERRSAQVQRIMTESLVRFDPGDAVRQTIDLYTRTIEERSTHTAPPPDLLASCRISA